MIKITLKEDSINSIIEQLTGDLKIEFTEAFQKSIKKKAAIIKREGKTILKNQFKNKKLLELANKRKKELIDNQTESEKIFKAKLKALNIQYEFQKIVYTKRSFYIIDFFLPKQMIVVEIDGGYHFNKDQRSKDKKRELELKTLGFKKIRRFTNNEACSIPLDTLDKFLQSV